jgi:hypothetical protein
MELFKYGLLYVQNGKSAFKEYKLKVDEDWEILESYDDEVLSKLPDTFEEFIEKLKSGSIPMMALKVLGGIEGCYRCAEDILIPSTAAEAILNFYENPDANVDLANLIYSTAVNLGHEVESFDSDGLCTHCSYSASKDD